MNFIFQINYVVECFSTVRGTKHKNYLISTQRYGQDMMFL